MEERGIKFEIITKEDAIRFLTNNNYYKKFSAYRKNFITIKRSDGINIYQHLDFAYLRELSKIDMHLRYIIFRMCLDIEHAVKVKLLQKATENVKEDGYNIVKNFFSEYPDMPRNISSHKTSPYCRELIEKHEQEYPIWVLLEIISFGEV